MVLRQESEVKVSYIIVTWNNADIIEECIDTLYQYSMVINEVIIVDNNSMDTTCQKIESLYKDKVILVKAGDNLGFSKANNLGLNYATGDYIFFVNPDVIFIEDIVGPMISLLNNNKNIGIVSPRLLYRDMSYQVSSCNFPSAQKIVWDDLHFSIFLNKKNKLRYAQAQCRTEENRYVDWTFGAAHFCRRCDVEKIGGYPSGYFMYGEDTEFCMMFKEKLGLKTYYMGEVALIHLGGYSEKQVLNSKKIIYGTTAALKFVNKHYGKRQLMHYRILLFISSFIKYIFYSLKSLVNSSQGVKNNTIKWLTSCQTVLGFKGERN